MGGLEAPDHGVANTDFGPRGAWLVEGEEAANLEHHLVGVAVAEDLDAHTRVRILGHECRGVVDEVVGHERERHGVAVGLRPASARTEPEACRRCQ